MLFQGGNWAQKRKGRVNTPALQRNPDIPDSSTAFIVDCVDHVQNACMP